MAKLFNANEQWNKERKIYHVIIGMLFIIVLVLGYQVKTKPSELYINIPPDLSEGAKFSATQQFKPNIFSFTQSVWTTLNGWNSNGEVDYKTNLEEYGNYLTASFASAMQDDYTQQDQAGELAGRIQHVSLAPGFTYSDADVVALGDGVWSVHLQLEIQQFQAGAKIKDYIADYWFRVVSDTGDPEHNGYLLAIDGFIQPPVRVSTIQ